MAPALTIDCPAAATRLGGPDGYALLDSGDGEKLEAVGGRRLIRPAPQAVWPRDPATCWDDAARFQRDKSGYGKWRGARLPAEGWSARIFDLDWGVRATRFGHLGLFAEMCGPWALIEALTERSVQAGGEPRLLNLFAYTGLLSLVGARAGAAVAHVDAAKGTVDWARDNARAAGLADAPIRWLVDDARKFTTRELRRERRYQLIALDPPTFGRGAGKEEWKVERDLAGLVADCARLLADDASLLLLTSHTPGLTGLGLANLVGPATAGRGGALHTGELLLASHGGAKALPSGSYAAWIGDAR